MNKIQEKNCIEICKEKKPLNGRITIPADKSISHRAAIIGSLARGRISIENYSKGADCLSTLFVLKGLGVEVESNDSNKLVITNKNGFIEPINYLDAGNSGTTIRLMSGILSGQKFYSVLTGDDSLRSRPMARVIKPLKQMGANIWAREDDTKAPISIKGGQLSAISYESPISSAQVKSAILLAGLFADGTTIVKEPFKSRDHTEKLLKYLEADIAVQDNEVRINKSNLVPKTLKIPGDISSAAFFIVAATIIPDSEILIENVGLNPTRTGIIDVLRSMGAKIEILNERFECGEEVGNLKVSYSSLKGIEINEDIIPRIIDELPIIAVAAAQAEGTTTVRGAGDLRNKESDRIKAVCSVLTSIGANIKETDDGFIIYGKTMLTGNCVVDSYHDHRIAMSAYIAGLVSDNPVQINGFNWVSISFPEFIDTFNILRKN